MKNSLNLETVAFFSVMPDAIFVLNEDKIIEYANPAALQCCRTSLSKIVSTSLAEWISISPAGKNSGQIDDRWDTGMANLERVGQIISADRQIPILFTTATVAQKTIVRARRMTDDGVTPMAEKQRQVSMLSQNQNRGHSRFAMSLVHELSQPLCTAILEVSLASKIAEKLPVDDISGKELRGSLAELGKLHQGMEKTLNKIRDFASKSLDEQWEICQPADLLNTVIDQVKYSFEAENLSVTLNDNKDIPGIFVGRNRLELVLSALMESIFNREKGISTGHLPTDENNLKITVTAEALKWVVFRIGPLSLVNNRKDEFGQDLSDTWKMRWLELDMLNACISAFGGEVVLPIDDSGILHIEFRLPVHLEDERSQLIALIDMLHSDLPENNIGV